LSFYEIYADFLENAFLSRKSDDEDLVREVCVEKTSVKIE
jgi:hypothetical protein